MPSKLFLLVFVISLMNSASTLPRFKRQFCNNCTGSTTAQSTTLSVRDLYPCTSKCQTTSQYSPVCGSNGITYDNMSKMQCAISCGANVSKVREGTCAPL